MKLTIKTLQQFTFKIDIDSEKTVKELKEQIEREHGKDYPIAHQKLIYSGKILADESKLAEYDVDEKKFIVLMITRPPPPPKVQQPTPSSTEKTSSSSSSGSTVKKEDAKQRAKSDEKRQSRSTGAALCATTTNTLTATTNTTTQSAASPAASTPSAAPSSNNPTTPTNLSTATTTTTTSTLQSDPVRLISAAATAAGPRTGQGSEQQSYMSARLANIMSQPQFRQIQELIQQSPHLLSPTIESLASTDPDMYSFISENPDIFVRALNQPPMSSLNLSPSARSSTTGSTGGQQADQGMRDLQQGVRNMTSGARQADMPFEINVSEHDREAIGRLKELGFSEIQAYQAYIACDKDEQLAANLLFQMEQ